MQTYYVRSKKESDELIKKLDLNCIKEEKIFNKYKEKDIKEAVKKYLLETNYKYYNMRDKENASGKYLYKLSSEEVLENMGWYNIFSVFESLSEADNRLVLQGEIYIDPNAKLIASLDNRKNISNRQAMYNPRYTLSLDLLQRNEPCIPGLKEIIDYVFIKKLFGIIVEFSFYEIPVGLHQENMIIWELRSNY